MRHHTNQISVKINPFLPPHPSPRRPSLASSSLSRLVVPLSHRIYKAPMEVHAMAQSLSVFTTTLFPSAIAFKTTMFGVLW